MGMFDHLFKANTLRRNENSPRYNEEFSMEHHDEFFDRIVLSPQNQYDRNGVHTNFSDNKLRITYNGLLAKSGADHVYAVIGYGDNDRWNDVQYHRMQHAGSQTFELLLPVNQSRNVNIAFKDSANNWDNNSGRNYIFNTFVEHGSH